jgi:23S rRNA (guanosine2251-2'-O)-methyltransferase
MPGIIAGRQPILEALKAGTVLERIVFLAGVQGRAIEEIRTLAQQNKVETVVVNKTQFRDLASNATTQGVVGIVPTKQFASLRDILAIPASRNEKGFLLILDEIEDPQNLGALVRTAECAGAHGVIIPKHHAAPVTSTTIKASAGATEHMAMAEVTNIVNTLETLKQEGYWIVGCDMAGETSYDAVDYTTPLALVVGGEGRGMRRLVREHCDHLVKIPLRGKIESLNASVAGALVLYEVVRQRHGSPQITSPG